MSASAMSPHSRSFRTEDYRYKERGLTGLMMIRGRGISVANLQIRVGHSRAKDDHHNGDGSASLAEGPAPVACQERAGWLEDTRIDRVQPGHIRHDEYLPVHSGRSRP